MRSDLTWSGRPVPVPVPSLFFTKRLELKVNKTVDKVSDHLKRYN